MCPKTVKDGFDKMHEYFKKLREKEQGKRKPTLDEWMK